MRRGIQEGSPEAGRTTFQTQRVSQLEEKAMSELSKTIDGLDVDAAVAAGSHVAAALIHGDIAKFREEGKNLLILIRERPDGGEFSVAFEFEKRAGGSIPIDEDTVRMALLSTVVTVYGLCRDGSVFDDPSQSSDSIVKFLRELVGSPKDCWAALTQLAEFSNRNQPLCAAIAKQWRKQYDLLTAKAEAL